MKWVPTENDGHVNLKRIWRITVRENGYGPGPRWWTVHLWPIDDPDRGSYVYSTHKSSEGAYADVLLLTGEF